MALKKHILNLGRGGSAALGSSLYFVNALKNNKLSIGSVLTLSKYKDYRVRVGAAWLLGTIGTRLAVAKLKIMEKDPNKYVGATAKMSLLEIYTKGITHYTPKQIKDYRNPYSKN